MARAVSRRFERRGLINQAQIQVVAKHGTRGLVMLVVFGKLAGLLCCVDVAGVAWLVASHGSLSAHWIIGIGSACMLYPLARLVQVGLLKPTDADVAFLQAVTNDPASAS